MALELNGSILSDIKKILGIAPTDTAFDLDVMIHINSAFDVLNQIGIGPAGGFVISGTDEKWNDFMLISGDAEGVNLPFNMVKSYIYLKVRVLFDPPTTAFHMEAMNKQIDEYEHRLSEQREWDLDPVDPRTVHPTHDEVVISNDYWRSWLAD